MCLISILYIYIYVYRWIDVCIYIYRELTTPQETNECNPKVHQRDATDAQKSRQWLYWNSRAF